MSQPVRPPAAVVWDFGGVLIHWDPYAAMVAAVGTSEADRFFGGFDFAAWNRGPDAGQRWADALTELAVAHPDLAGLGAAYRSHFADSLVGDVPGSVALLRELHAASIRLLGLTNWAEETYYGYAPQRFDFLALFERVFVSGEVGLAKPDPRIFELVSDQVGLPLTELLLIDDTGANVEAARALGMDAVVFTDADTLRVDLRQRGLPV